MTASFNGTAWSASPQATTNSSGQLLLAGTTGPANAPCPHSDPCERLVLLGAEDFVGAARYSTSGGGGALFSYRDGDAILGQYEVVGEPPTFAVDSYDVSRGAVTGRFELTLARAFSAFRDGAFVPPDTVRLRDGRFTVPLSNQID